MSVQQPQAPVELKTFKKYRDQFNQNVIDIVNILNQVFNQNDSQTINPPNPSLKPNLIEINAGTIPGDDIFMNLIKPNGKAIGKEKEELLKKVCKNIVLIYTHPLPNLDFNIDPKDNLLIPLANQVKETGGFFSSNATKNIGKFGVKANNFEQYSYTKEGAFTSKPLTDISDKICKQQPVKDFQEYLYNKLYVLVKLRGILNLNDDDQINKYEIFFERNKEPNGRDKKKAQTKIEKAKNEFNHWFDFIKGLFQIVLSDKYNKDLLKDIIGAFNTTNVNTNSLCKSLVPLCDTSVDYSEDDIKDMCVETKLESVRDPINCEIIQQKAATQKRINGQNQKSNDLKKQLSKYRSKEDKPRVDNVLKAYKDLEKNQKEILSSKNPKEKENKLKGILDSKDSQLKEQQKLLEQLEKKKIEEEKAADKKAADKKAAEKAAEKVKTIVKTSEEIELKDIEKKITPEEEEIIKGRRIEENLKELDDELKKKKDENKISYEEFKRQKTKLIELEKKIGDQKATKKDKDKEKDELTQPVKKKRIGDVKRIFECLGTDGLTTEIKSAIESSTDDDDEKEILQNLLTAHTLYRKTEKVVS